MNRVRYGTAAIAAAITALLLADGVSGDKDLSWP